MFSIEKAVTFFVFGLVGVFTLSMAAEAVAKKPAACAGSKRNGQVVGCNGGTCPAATPTCALTPAGPALPKTGCACF
jgi:hypothetical protein